MFIRRHYLIILVALVIVCTHATMASACPGCKQALGTAEGEQANMVNGYYWSILFMLAMPFTLFGLFAGSMYLAVRRARNAERGTRNLQSHAASDASLSSTTVPTS